MSAATGPTSNSVPAPSGVTGEPGSGPATAVEPSVNADPASGVQPRQKQQGGDRPMEDPVDGPPSTSTPATKDEPTSAPSGAPPAGGPPAGGSDGPEVEKESHGEGTGEKYVKSTGMAADGGDFDATKPGAGREADRLLSEKGIHHGVDTKENEEVGKPSKHEAKKEAAGGTAEEGGKPSTTQKIKEKLHIK